MRSAYRQYHSTETALLRVSNDILRAVDNKLDVMLLDLSSAFDSITMIFYLSRLNSLVFLGKLDQKQLSLKNRDQIFYLSTLAFHRAQFLAPCFSTCMFSPLLAFLDNPNKTELIHFSSRFSKNPPLANLQIGSTIIESSNEIHIPRVQMDRHLDMSAQIRKVCRSCSNSLRNIGRIRKCVSNADAKRLSEAFILSYLSMLTFYFLNFQIEN